MGYIFDILAVIGMIWIISDSKIMKPIREWVTYKSINIGYMINCWGCLSVWVSIIYIFLPYRNYFKFIFATVIISVLLQKILSKLK